jgi:hypothetical protein
VGENEGVKNLDHLNNVALNITQPVSFETLKNAGHYFGVYNLFGSETIFFRPDLFNPFIDLILNFCDEVESNLSNFNTDFL